MPKVSAGLPVYNGEMWIQYAIESVLNQTFKDLELIIIDDGSIDRTIDIINSYNDNRIRLIEQKNQGFTVATNTHIANCQGEYLCFIGDDDIWHPQKIEKQVNFMENTASDLIHSNVIHIDKNGQYIGTRNPKFPMSLPREEYIKKLFLKNHVCHQTVFISQKVFEKVGGFDNQLKIISDHEMWTRAAKAFNFGYINEPLAKKRIHDQQISNNKLVMVNDLFYFIEKAEKMYPFLHNSVEKRKKISNAYLIWGKNELKQSNLTRAKEKFLQAYKTYPSLMYKFGSMSPSTYIKFEHMSSLLGQIKFKLQSHKPQLASKTKCYLQ